MYINNFFSFLFLLEHLSEMGSEGWPQNLSRTRRKKVCMFYSTEKKAHVFQLALST